MTEAEISFVILWMLIGVVFYSITIGLITSFFKETDTKQSLLKNRLKQMEQFCKELGISQQLEDSLTKALEYSSNVLTYQWMGSNNRIFEELPMHLKFEFLKAIYGKILTECPFFPTGNIGFIVRIIPLLKPVFYPAGSTIFQANDFSSQSTASLLSILS